MPTAVAVGVGAGFLPVGPASPIVADRYISSEATNGYSVGVDTYDGTAPFWDGVAVDSAGPWLSLAPLDGLLEDVTVAVNGAAIGTAAAGEVFIKANITFAEQVPYTTTFSLSTADSALFRIRATTGPESLTFGKIILDGTTNPTVAIIRITNTATQPGLTFNGTRIVGILPPAGAVLSQCNAGTDVPTLSITDLQFVGVTTDSNVITWPVQNGTVDIDGIDFGDFTLAGTGNDTVLSLQSGVQTLGLGETARPGTDPVEVQRINGAFTASGASGVKKIVSIENQNGFTLHGTTSLTLDLSANANLSGWLLHAGSNQPFDSPYNTLVTVHGDIYNSTGLSIIGEVAGTGTSYGILGGTDAISGGDDTRLDSFGQIDIYDCKVDNDVTVNTTIHGIMQGGKNGGVIKRCESAGARHTIILKQTEDVFVHSNLVERAKMDYLFCPKGGAGNKVFNNTIIVSGDWNGISEHSGIQDATSSKPATGTEFANNLTLVEAGATPQDPETVREKDATSSSTYKNSNYWGEDDNDLAADGFFLEGTVANPLDPPDTLANFIANGSTTDITNVDPVLDANYRPTDSSPDAIKSGGLKWWTSEDHKDLDGNDFSDTPSVGCYQSTFV